MFSEDRDGVKREGKGPSTEGVRLSLCGHGSKQVLAVAVENFLLSRSVRSLKEYIDTPLCGPLLSLSGEIIEERSSLHFLKLLWTLFANGLLWLVNQISTFLQNALRTSVLKTQWNKKMNKPCSELNIVKRYWKTVSLSFTQIKPNAQVNPSNGNKMIVDLTPYRTERTLDSWRSLFRRELISFITLQRIMMLIIITRIAGPLNVQIVDLSVDSQQLVLVP